MNANDQIIQLAALQVSIYLLQPADLKSHFNHERSVVESYRGRQLLELLQNADDAFDPAKRPTKLLFRLLPGCLVAANSGRPFNYGGIESLVVTDASPKQLHRTRCIGNKGLGFRSVLSWSPSPLVFSGEWSVGFSADVARRNVEELAKANESIGSVVQHWRDVRTDLPAPIMRFPFVPSPDDIHLRLAREIMAEGFDTVIVLPFQEGATDPRVRADIVSQFYELAGETLLFCNHLEELILESPADSIRRQWTLVRSDADRHERVHIAGEEGTPRAWTIHRRHGELPADKVDSTNRDTPGWEASVAVPDDGVLEPGTSKLCVFFPTDEVLPMRMLVHATLETNDSRKRLNDHPANRFVLEQVAELIATVAEEECHQDPSRGLYLLAGCEHSDPELIKLGFWNSLKVACRNRALFPRLDGSAVSASEVRTAPHAVWSKIIPPAVMPELLNVKTGIAVEDFIQSIGLQGYTHRRSGNVLNDML